MYTTVQLERMYIIEGICSKVNKVGYVTVNQNNAAFIVPE